MKIVAMGDVHMDWAALNSFVNQHKPDIILQCGDFGYWPKRELTIKERNKLKHGGHLLEPNMQNHTRLYWCDGNHEDFWTLRDRTSDELWRRVYYMPRGKTLTLPDGRIVLFMGGAASVDKQWRITGLSWFPEEEITMADYEKLDPNMRVDIVISHTCPMELPMESHLYGYEATRLNDWSRKALSMIHQRYRPSLWYFGHWHRYESWFCRDTRFTALNMSRETGWWEEVKGAE